MIGAGKRAASAVGSNGVPTASVARMAIGGTAGASRCIMSSACGCRCSLARAMVVLTFRPEFVPAWAMHVKRGVSKCR